MLPPPAPLQRPASKAASGEIIGVIKGETVGLTPALTLLAMRAAGKETLPRKRERDVWKVVSLVMLLAVVALLVAVLL